MIVRRETLAEALDGIEAGALAGASAVVVSRSWWSGVSPREQDAFRDRAARAGIRLYADDSMRSHYVEIRDDAAGPTLSSEHPT